MIVLRKPASKRLPIGLDIGRFGVRAAQLVSERRGYRILSADSQDWTGDDVAENEMEAVADRWIQTCVRSTPFRGKEVRVALGQPGVDFHTLELPATLPGTSGPEVEQVLGFEMERVLQDSQDSYEIRHWPLPTVRSDSLNVMGVAARHDKVMAAHARCQGNGLSCRGVDTEATALARAGMLLHDWGDDEVWGLLDAGGSGCRIVLGIRGAPVLIRRIASGGDAWTEQIADSLQIPRRAAEIQKCTHGILPPRTNHGATGFSRLVRGSSGRSDGAVGRGGLGESCGEEVAAMLMNVLRGDLIELAGEVKRSFDYALSCYPSHRVGGLVLVGGSSAMNNLPEFLGGLLGISVRRASSYLDDSACRLVWPTSRQMALDRSILAVGLSLEMGGDG